MSKKLKTNKKNTLKINDRSYIQVVKGEEGEPTKIYLVTLLPKLFINGYEETKTRLVPEKDNNLQDILKELQKSNVRIDEKLNTLAKTIGNTGLFSSSSVSDAVSNLGKKLENIGISVQEQIEEYDKNKRYKKLFNTDFFKRAKRIKQFENMKETELAGLLMNVVDNYSDKAKKIIADIKKEEN